MDFQGKTVLVFLEEDNIQRAYFRIRPLLTADEVVTPEALAAFPDDGYLRIVPDKNEQHTFKDRMRTICGLCIVDLSDLPPDAAKIRSNKNYAPQRGETNQFIIYSDAVRAMPEKLLYQVVPEDGIAQAHTPLVYKRDGANIMGPVRRADGEFEGESVRLQPDSRDIHCVTLPDGKELLFYWPAPAQKPAPVSAPKPVVPAPKPTSAAAPAPLSAPDIIERLNAPVVTPSANLLKPAAPERPVVDSPVANYNGTKLYQGVARRAAPKRAYNPLIETVEQQRYAARYESPGAVLGDAAALREVDNPVEYFRAALQGVWNDPNTHQQTASIILSMSGMRGLLAKMVTSEHDDLAIAAMHSQLNDLEAERLMTLMRLDEAKKDLTALRKEALGLLTREEQAALDGVKSEIAVAESSLDELKRQIADLSARREKLVEANNLLGAPRRVSPAPGGTATREEMIARVKSCLEAQGFDASEDDACALLLLFALSDKRMTFSAQNPEDAALAVLALVHALGGVCADAPNGIGAERTADDVPVFQFVNDREIVFTHEQGVTTCSPVRDGKWRTPVFALSVKPFAFPGEMPACPPLSERHIRRAMLEGASEINPEAIALIRAFREALIAACAPLSLSDAGKLFAFISVAQNVMKGGVAAALDAGIAAYIVPYIKQNNLDASPFAALFDALPRARKTVQ